MGKIDEQLSEQFYRWEMRGRGGLLFDAPITPEPPFFPFSGHFLPRRNAVDDGRRETIGSRFLSFFGNRTEESSTGESAEVEQEPEPQFCQPEELIELQLTLPELRSPSAESVEAFLHQVCREGQPLCLEILGEEREIVPQFVAAPSAAARIERALKASFSDMTVTHSSHAFQQAWHQSEDCFGIVELGLGVEFMIPLGNPRTELLTSIVTALDGLAEGELGLCQILFEPAQNNWGESIVAAVTDENGNAFFINRPELIQATAQKLASPLFGVVIRLAASAAQPERAWEIIADMASGFSALSRAGSNYLIPLRNDSYAPSDHEDDLLSRLSRRSGMILNLDELTRFLTLPTASVSRRLRRNTAKSQPAPAATCHSGSLILGENLHAGVAAEVRLAPEQRVRHMHLIGASGTGKSTLLFNLIRQDIENGQGIALLDPHGDLADKVLGIIPAERIKDVVLIDPSDEEYSVGFNILSAHSDLEKTVLASDLISVFERLSTSWGDSMNAVLRNAILAFLESEQGGTLADLRRFLIDPAYRATFLESVSDPEVVYYWQKAFPQLTGNKSIGPVVTRLDTFLAPKPIRFMVSQRENKLDFSRIMDERKIFLAKLPQGEIGRENSYLLGSLIVAKFQQAAMSRQRLREEDRNLFSLYLDEFHHFITPSLAEMLSGARKYRVALVLAHQELRQLQRDAEVASATLSNPYTRVVFRVGDADARTLADGFSSFEAKDLQSLGVGEAICRVERSDYDFNISIPLPEEPDTVTASSTRQRVIEASRSRYGARRAEVEAKLREALYTSPATAKPSPKREDVRESLPDVTSQSVIPESVAPEQAIAPSTAPVVVSESTRPAGMGRGGEDHQLIVANLASEAARLGFRTIKECAVSGGRIDLVIESGRCRLAAEVAVHSNTAHEIENLQKCFDSKPDFIVSVSPHENVRENIAKSAARSFDPEALRKIRFESPETILELLRQIAQKQEAPAEPDTPTTRVIAGRKVRTRHLEMSLEERRKKEAEEIETIADLLRNRSSREKED
ncbi:MAG: type IV secretion system DNA-binding domain-containing protein [Verrucomicrobiota bacterium]